MTGSWEKKISNHYVLIFLLVALSSFVMIPSVNGVFLNWDDITYVVSNPLVKQTSIVNLVELFTTPEVLGNYHPLTILYYNLAYYFFGSNPLGYHILAILIHSINVVLVFLFIRLISKNIWVAFFTALLFGVHPAHVEAVAWISGAKDLLYVLFFLMGLITYEKQQINPSALMRTGVWVFFILALMSKGMAVVFPMVLVLLDYKRNPNFRLSDVLNKAPFLLLSLAWGVLTYFIQSGSGAMSNVNAFEQLVYGIYSLSRYLIFSIIPFPLSPVHPYPSQLGQTIPGFVFVSGSLGVLGFSFLVYHFKKSKNLIFGLLFFIACIFPVLQFVSVGITVFNERYTYLSYIGLFYFLSILIYEYFISQAGLQKKLMVIAIGLVFSVYALKSFNHSSAWATDEVLWSTVISAYPNDFFGYYQRGVQRSHRNENERAVEDLTTSIVLLGSNPKAFMERGVAFMKLQRWELALGDFQSTIKNAPTFYNAWVNAGVVSMNLGRLKEAEKYLENAIKIDPSSILGYINHGIALTGNNKYAEAIVDFNRVLELDANNQDALFLRGQSNFYLNRFNLAQDDFNVLVKLYPTNPDYQIWLDKVNG